MMGSMIGADPGYFRYIYRLFVSICAITMLCGIAVANPTEEAPTSAPVMQIKVQEASVATSIGSGEGAVESLLKKFQGFNDEDWRRIGEGMAGASPAKAGYVVGFMKEMMTDKRSLQAVLMLLGLSGIQDKGLTNVANAVGHALPKIGVGYLNQEEANRLLSVMSAPHIRRDPATCVDRESAETPSNFMTDEEFLEFLSLIKSGVLRFVAEVDRPLLKPSQKTITLMRDEVARAEESAIREYSLPAAQRCAKNKFLMMGLDQLIGEKRDMAAHMIAWSFAGF